MSAPSSLPQNNTVEISEAEYRRLLALAGNAPGASLDASTNAVNAPQLEDLEVKSYTDDPIFKNGLVVRPKGEPGRGKKNGNRHGYSLEGCSSLGKARFDLVHHTVTRLAGKYLDITQCYSDNDIDRIKFVINECKAFHPSLKYFDNDWLVKDILQQHLKYTKGKYKFADFGEADLLECIQAGRYVKKNRVTNTAGNNTENVDEPRDSNQDIDDGTMVVPQGNRSTEASTINEHDEVIEELGDGKEDDEAEDDVEEMEDNEQVEHDVESMVRRQLRPPVSKAAVPPVSSTFKVLSASTSNKIVNTSMKITGQAIASKPPRAPPKTSNKAASSSRSAGTPKAQSAKDSRASKVAFKRPRVVSSDDSDIDGTEHVPKRTSGVGLSTRQTRGRGQAASATGTSHKAKDAPRHTAKK
ncbi:hypothetical protein FRC17_005141, partial [Serendipita sp. 399]